MSKASAIVYALALAFAGSTRAAIPGDDGNEFFEKQVRPIFAQRCYECHSAGKKVKGGLSLDTREGLFKGGELGAVVVPGKPNESLLIKAVRYADEDLQMPPKHRLDAKEIALLEKWVALGAPYPVGSSVPDKGKGTDHWAFK